MYYDIYVVIYNIYELNNTYDINYFYLFIFIYIKIQ
jgi:hypothetical protein